MNMILITVIFVIINYLLCKLVVDSHIKMPNINVPEHRDLVLRRGRRRSEQR